MLKFKQIIPMTLAAALLALAPAMPANDKKELDPKRLAAITESAESAADFRNLGQLYERRAAMLDEKAERHDKLEQRFSHAPASLLAKRGYSWDTPRRQRDLAAKARKDAAEARQMAQVHLSRADARSADVD